MISIKNVVFYLSYLTGLIGFLSVVRFISPVYSTLFILLFITGIFFDKKEKSILPRWALNIISLSVVLFLFFRVNLDNPVIPVVETLLILLGIKFLEKKEFRDFMQIYTISVFLLAGSALLTIDISFMLFFIALFFLVVVSTIFLTYYSQDRELILDLKTFKKIIKKIILIPLFTIPVSTFIFLILPRTQYPVFNFLNTGSSGRTGFSDTVELGDVSEIQEENSVIMRIKSDKKLSDDVYIRGLVLNFFDGKRWYRRIIKSEEKVIGYPVKQEIILEPYGDRYLFGIDVPVLFQDVFVRKSYDFVYMTDRRIFNRKKYKVISIIPSMIEAEKIDFKGYTQYPKNIKSEIIKLAKRLKGKDRIQTIRNTISFLKNNYKYTLKNLSTGKDPLYEFLFVKKAGNCEYFASAAAILLRINHIPARIVVGYKGVKYNKLGNYYIVPQSFAHAWIEVYQNRAWFRYDPTPSYSAKILKNKKENQFIEKLKAFWDAVEYAYINMIINFDFKKQMEIFKKTSSSLSRLKTDFSIKKEYFMILLFPVFIYLLIKIYRNYSFNKKAEERIINKFLAKMKKLGYEKKENEGLEEFVLKIDDKEIRKKAYEFVMEFESIYYRDRDFTKEDLERLSELIHKI